MPDPPDDQRPAVLMTGPPGWLSGPCYDQNGPDVLAPFTGRCLINDHARRWMGREVELMQNVAAVVAEYAAAKAAGNFDIAAVIAGESVGLIHDIPPAAEIVERIAGEADQILQGRRNFQAAPQH